MSFWQSFSDHSEAGFCCQMSAAARRAAADANEITSLAPVIMCCVPHSLLELPFSLPANRFDRERGFSLEDVFGVQSVQG